MYMYIHMYYIILIFVNVLCPIISVLTKFGVAEPLTVLECKVNKAYNFFKL